MGAIDREASELYSILKDVGVGRERCLLTIKRGWINLSVDNKLLFEFNRKKTFHLNELGQQVDEVIYKFKENGNVKNTTDWAIVRALLVIEINKIK